jgi:hypothetical protein
MHMPNRTARFGSTLLAVLLAGVWFTTASHSAPAEAETCLAGPKGAVPAGGHWYYRVERGTKRHCWYIGEAKEKAARAASANSSASADPASPPKKSATRTAIADARAELPSPQMEAEPATGITGQRTAAAAANTAAVDTDQSAGAWDTNTQSSDQSLVFASRWPESSGASPSASPATTPAPETYQPAATLQPDAAPALAPAIAPVALAAADSSAAGRTGSIQTLLIVIIGALSLAGLMASAIFRFGGMRWTGRRDISGDRRDRRAIWDSASPSPMAYPSSGAPIPTADIPREKPRAADDPNRRIGEMLARLSRTAPT